MFPRKGYVSTKHQRLIDEKYVVENLSKEFTISYDELDEKESLQKTWAAIAALVPKQTNIVTASTPTRSSSLASLQSVGRSMRSKSKAPPLVYFDYEDNVWFGNHTKSNHRVKTTKKLQIIRNIHREMCNCKQFSLAVVKLPHTTQENGNITVSATHRVTCMHIDTLMFQLSFEEELNDIIGA